MRFDLHIHSNHSTDSSMSIDDILNQAVKKGLDGIAICDHNTAAGSYHARKRARELNLPLLVLPGIEVSTKEGHIIVLGIRENIQPNLSLQETIRIAHLKGGTVIAAHPFKMRSIGNVEGLEIDAIETFNSRCIFGENTKAKKMAQALGKPEVGGSDSHMPATIGLGYTDIDSDPDEASILKAIREGKTRSCGKVAPMYVIGIQVVRRFLQRIKKLRKQFYSKIFDDSGTM
jgi:predicted metal-dependent phosphoesterase TrpH